MIAIVITSTVAAIAYATPIVGLPVGTILSSGTINDEIILHVRAPLPLAVEGNSENEDQEYEWRADLYTSGSSNFTVQDVVYAPAATPVGTLTLGFS